MGISPFDLQKIILKKLTPPETLDGYSQWMINKIFSCDKQLCHFAKVADQMDMTNQEHFDFYYHGIPRSNRWIKYLAKKPKDSEHLKMIADYFNCNLTCAAEYDKMIAKPEMKRIKELFTHKEMQRTKKK